MIVLQDKSLPSVWEEYEALKKLLPENCYKRKCSNRKQHFKWVNDIEYYEAQGLIRVEGIVVRSSPKGMAIWFHENYQITPIRTGLSLFRGSPWSSPWLSREIVCRVCRCPDPKRKRDTHQNCFRCRQQRDRRQPVHQHIHSQDSYLQYLQEDQRYQPASGYAMAL